MTWLIKLMSKKEVIRYVFERIIFPGAEEYVKKTSNDWDDKALDFLKALYNHLMLKA